MAVDVVLAAYGHRPTIPDSAPTECSARWEQVVLSQAPVYEILGLRGAELFGRARLAQHLLDLAFELFKTGLVCGWRGGDLGDDPRRRWRQCCDGRCRFEFRQRRE